MLTKRIIACLDVRGGRVVKGVQFVDIVDAGDPAELAGQYRELRGHHPQLTILGGCCGTDATHVDAIAQACL